MKKLSEKLKIGVIGLGYVGLPLAVGFAEKYDVTGFDVKKSRVEELSAHSDSTLETSKEQLEHVSERLKFSCDPESIRGMDVYIVTVPTPVDIYNRPDLSPLYSASRTAGGVMGRGAVVIYESTVYPGCTEEECVPVLESASGLAYNTDFFCGYSPERINPGDKEHTFSKIKKVTSGSTPEAAEFIDSLYSSIVSAGTHRVSSIKVAEAAKVIENSQRDINIAFMNELSKLFHRMGIDTLEVLEASGTKWNFLPFRPGLVGGHCIGVDPYYLTHKAQSLGYHPEIILAGRRLNDGMAQFVASETVKLMISKDIHIKGARILVCGVTFKENCPDIRNSKVADIVKELLSYGCEVDILDPLVKSDDIQKFYGFKALDAKRINDVEVKLYSSVIIAVPHSAFKEYFRDYVRPSGQVLYDIKGILPRDKSDGRL